MVSVEELQKVVVEITKEKVNPQEPPSHPPTTISGQSQEQALSDTIAKVDSTKLDTSTTEEKAKEKTRHQNISVTTTQSQGAPPLITIIDQGGTENKEENPKEKEQEEIHTLINLPTIGTPTTTH